MVAVGRFVAVVVCLTWCAVAAAQGQTLPSEQGLSSLGLKRAWWGRANLDPTQDRVQFLTADEQVVYVQSYTGGITGFDAETGKRLWARQLGPQQQAGFAAGSNDTEVLITAGLVMYCLDKPTGQTKWKLDLPHHPSATPGVDDDHVYVPMNDGSVYEFNLNTIHKLSDAGQLPQWSLLARGWRYQTPRPVLSPPASDGILVTFASSNGTLYAVNADGVKLKFQFEAASPVTAPVAYKGTTIYLCDVDARMYCISAVSGLTRWTFATGSPVRQQPRPVGDVVFAVADHGGLYCLDDQTGVQVWRNDEVAEFISVTNDRIYAANELDNLLILDRKTGETQATFPLRNFPIRISNARTDRIYASTKDGLVICLRETDLNMPIFHLFPDRKPILPEFAPDEEGGEMPAEKPADAAAEEAK